MWPVIAMAAMSALKANQDQNRVNEQNRAAATMTRYSPWTGMQGQTSMRPDSMGTLMQGVMAGMMMNQQMKGNSPWGQQQGSAHTMDANKGLK